MLEYVFLCVQQSAVFAHVGVGGVTTVVLMQNKVTLTYHTEHTV